MFFRDKGLGVPSTALFLDLFSVKEAAEGFLYLSKCASAPLIISDLPSSHNFGKSVTSLLVVATGSTTPLTRKTHWASWPSGPLLRIYVRFSLVKFGLVFVSYRMSLILHWLCVFSSIRPDLSPEDEVVKRKLATCLPRAYSELIRSDVPGFQVRGPPALLL